MSSEIYQLFQQLIYSEPVQKMANLAYRARHAVLVLPLCLLICYVGLSLLSYNELDNAWSHTRGFGAGVPLPINEVQNFGGRLGAWIADILHLLFGVGAWAILLWLAHEVYCATTKRPIGLFLRLPTYLFLWACLDIFLYAYAVNGEQNPIQIGGVVGYECYTALSMLVGRWGAMIFAIVGFFVVSGLLVDWRRLYYWVGFNVKSMSSPEYVTHNAANGSLFGKPNGAFSYQNNPENTKQDTQPSHQKTNEQVGQGVLASFLTKSGLREGMKDKPQPIDHSVRLSSQFEEIAPEPSVQKPTTTPKKRKKMTLLTDYGDGLVSERVIPEKSVMLNGKLTGKQNPIKTGLPDNHSTFDPEQFVNLSLTGKPNQTTAVPAVMSYGDANVDVHNDANSANLSAFAEPVNPPNIHIPNISAAVVQAVNVPTQAPTIQAPTIQNVAPQQFVAQTPVHEPTIYPANTQDQRVSENHVEATPAPELAAHPTSHPTSTNKKAQVLDKLLNADNEPKHKLGGALFESRNEVHWRDVLPNNLSPTRESPAQTAPNVSPHYKAQDEERSAAPYVGNDNNEVFAGFEFLQKDQKKNNVISQNLPSAEPLQVAEPTQAIPAPVPMPTPKPIKKPDADELAAAGKSLAMQTAEYRKQLPPLPEPSLLDPAMDNQVGYSEQQLLELAELLQIKLKEFGVSAKVVNVIQGPVITSFEVELAAGVKASKVTRISQDLARSLSMGSLRVVEVIVGKPYIGIEIPNRHKQIIKLTELIHSPDYHNPNLDIAIAMGKDISGKPYIADLAKAPHMLVAGTTGSGKSVLVNAMILSMLLKYTPEQLRLILIDPKMLEFAPYNDIPHLLTPVVTDMDEAASALSWCVGEMERRYQLMGLLKVRKISEFNKKVLAAEQSGKPILDPLWRPLDSVSVTSAPKLKPLPLIVVVADEFADMMMQVGKAAEEMIVRLAQKSRAAGIHLVLATQRPSSEVVTGLIKSNVPSRVGLRVNDKMNSRIILDASGADDLLGHGDMLFLPPAQNDLVRLHGAYVTDDEVNRITDAWRERGSPNYIETVATTYFAGKDGDDMGGGAGQNDEFYDKAVSLVLEEGITSISKIQRRLQVGYNRAANLVEAMEYNGILSAPDNSGKRSVL